MNAPIDRELLSVAIGNAVVGSDCQELIAEGIVDAIEQLRMGRLTIALARLENLALHLITNIDLHS